ncbi:hypothetical protein Tco_0937643 [Tanacetum coccineum]|uniref:Uncharacterized protein n=1 Tax=Tanacetum coccineum TaxID=301880 RepID=A0ABQ5DFS4_9ASTR
MLFLLIMNLYVPFGIPFDPKRYYKDGDCTIMLRRPRSIRHMAPLPPRKQRHPFLRYQGLEYSDADIADFEERMVMEHRNYAGVVVFTSQAWGRLFDTGRSLVWELILEFLSTLRFGEFILALGLHTGEEMESLGFARYWSESERMIPEKGDLHDYWMGISTDGDFLGPPPFYTLIRVRWPDVRSVNIPYLLARYLRKFDAGRKSGAHIFGEQFVGQLAQHFGLLTAEILGGLTVIALELLIINMDELVRLQIFVQLDDTWAWVAMGPERQLDAMVGALGVAQDAFIVDEGGQADPAPIQAPPPPPPAAAKTMPQRMARLRRTTTPNPYSAATQFGGVTRMMMEHHDDVGVVVFTSRLGGLFDTRGLLVWELILERHLSWRQFILALGLHTGEEMESSGFARYWSKSERDSLVIDEGGQANPVLVQAQPPLPPPAAARTMPQRMARLEEDVHEIHGALTEQCEVIDAMSHDFSRFCTWTTTSLARMMDKASVTYTSYSQIPREYQRRVRCRTDGANTSIAQQDLQQPDP